MKPPAKIKGSGRKGAGPSRGYLDGQM
ncbi:MAG: hypothetical protein V7604_2808, partial [Hyphomicrobiales bacterium]